ncbi:MAG TPA: FMN reductase [Mycobacterium sp.]
MTTPRIAVVSAGLSQPSSTRLLADRLADATVEALAESGRRPLVEVVELRDHAHDLANNLITGFPAAGLREAIDQVSGADGLIAVTPIFSASYSGLFKTFFDVLDQDALTGLPVLIGATGGTARHSLALEHAIRPLFTYLRAVVVPTAVYAASGDWGADGDSAGGLSDRIGRAAAEFAALVARRAADGPVGPSGEVVPFAQLLTQQRA